MTVPQAMCLRLWGSKNDREIYSSPGVFIKQHIKRSTALELTEMFNAQFGTNKSVGAIRIWCKSHGLGKQFLIEPRYTDEQLTFIYANKNLTNAELTERFNKRFGTDKNLTISRM